VTGLTSCALCGASMAASHGARGTWQLRECAQCGHVQSPAASLAAGAAEAEQRRYFGDDFAGMSDAWTGAFDRANARRVTRRLRSLLESGHVLEVGPGRGATLEALAAAGYRAEGLDVSEAVADRVRLRAGVTVHAGALDAHSRRTPRPAYDAIIMRHVLEHFTHPAGALRASAEMVAPGGWLHVAVPHAAAPQAALSGWTGYQPYHLHYFSIPNLVQLVEAAGFQVERCTTREPFSGWFNAVANSLRGGRASDANGHAVRRGAAHHAYQALRLVAGVSLWPVRAAQARLGYGEEIEIWARRAAR
jgi:2-polyprenyl-3-methyl-5-hydroxy-6-metoxy-1,4-benzoquinol methylase